ncbi:MAG: response regulator, partial [Pseudoalteromonas sp.]
SCRVEGRVLVVDDLRDLRMLVGHMLTSAGADVVYAENGKQALHKVEQARSEGKPFDIVFLDIHMPVMGGKEATIELRRQGFKGAIIALTAATMKGIKSELTALGFNEVIGKPVDASHLYQCLEEYLTQTKDADITELPKTQKSDESDQVLPRFLLVEDDADAAQITQLLLESLGVNTSIARSFEQCISMLKGDSQYDKALLDMHLPDGSGLELAQHIKQHYPHIERVIVSGVEPNPIQIEQLKIESVLLKPINLSLLSSLIDD